MGAIEELAWKALGRASQQHALSGLRTWLGRRKPWVGFSPTATSPREYTIDASDLPSGDLVLQATEQLRNHGIVVLAGLFSPEEMNGAANDVRQLVGRAGALEASHGYGVDLEEVRLRDEKHGSFLELVKAETPTILRRQRSKDAVDGGMLEVHKVDHLATSWGCEALQHLVSDPRMEAVEHIVAAVHTWTDDFLNLYVNDGVTNARGLHIDSIRGSYKAFLYLTDCRSSQDGPYCFVPGTHADAARLTKGVHVNAARGRSTTDFPELDDSKHVIVGPAGTLIITSQSGVHGGHSQSEHGYRAALVRNFSDFSDFS